MSVRNVARHIGNAVPPRLGEVIGISIIEHLKQVTQDGKN
jgi:DNA (cytosine-5)-methyltransferase 1